AGPVLSLRLDARHDTSGESSNTACASPEPSCSAVPRPDAYTHDPGGTIVHRRILAPSLAALLAATSLAAQDASDRTVDVHGFGSWAYGKTNEPNVYLAGDPEGNYRRSDLSINTAARVGDRLSVVGQ